MFKLSPLQKKYNITLQQFFFWHTDHVKKIKINNNKNFQSKKGDIKTP